MARWNFHKNRCMTCRKALVQPKTGRTRKYCSEACRKRRFRSRRGSLSRRTRALGREVDERRKLPFGERTFNPTLYEPIHDLSLRRWVYECQTCGQPYVVERLRGGPQPSRFCSQNCAKRAAYAWKVYGNAYERAQQRGEVNPVVEERLWLHKLSPLCPTCGRPFAPNVTPDGRRKRGRPRIYCSTYCQKMAYEERIKNKTGRARIHRFRLCPVCGIKFDRTDALGRRAKRYCSRTCGDKLKWRRQNARRAGRTPADRVYRQADRSVEQRRGVKWSRAFRTLRADYHRAKMPIPPLKIVPGLGLVPEGTSEAVIAMSQAVAASAEISRRGKSESRRGCGG